MYEPHAEAFPGEFNTFATGCAKWNKAPAARHATSNSFTLAERLATGLVVVFPFSIVVVESKDHNTSVDTYT